MRVIEASMEQGWTERAGETRDPRESPPTSGIVRHDSHMQKSRKTGDAVTINKTNLLINCLALTHRQPCCRPECNELCNKSKDHISYKDAWQ
ncbi:hypothetical protein PR048_019349 [Dryococelus australis]|uniref:Uncharacterized protein n=1 Tax=Dryococelus australis TaxID=614101 RepID=A0ABQ9H394_9NEOP|nr:hypothetical protein PR048_019349 [Dryococelus australis]